jgi:pyruvate dehydrogenase E1 component alpha subunit
VRAAAYGIPGEYVEGNDPLAIYDAAERAIARARAGDGPSLIEIETYRLAGHFMGDAEAYRPEGEKEELFSKDPIPAFRMHLLDSGALDEATLTKIEDAMHGEVDEAFEFARSAAEPNPAEALDKVFA